MQTPTFDSLLQEKTSPQKAIELLKEGNKRFLSAKPLNRNFLEQISKTANGQYPFASIISCIDSRIPTEIIFDQGIGDIFNIRIAGNFVNQDILGSLEFACELANSKLIMVMGHTSCGAIKGACDNAKLGNLTQMLGKIKPAVNAVKTRDGEKRNSDNQNFVNKVSKKNVELTINNILKNSSVINHLVTKNKIALVGAMYDVKTGNVDFI